MFQTLVFVSLLGCGGFLFCKIEGTTYVDGIYWMVTTTLLVGFGDITPRTTVMRVLTFPLTIIAIVLLALIVASIVQILGDRARHRKLEMKQRLKRKLSERKRLHTMRIRLWKKEVDPLRLERRLTLQEELDNLRKLDKRRERRTNLRSMAIGFGVFLVFWFVGGLIFSLVEVNYSLNEN
jgi:Ion channel